LLGVNVNAGDLCLERRWPVDRFGVVLTRLLEDRPTLRLVLTGSPSERPYVSSVLETIPAALRPRVFVAAGAWSLGEFIAGLSLLAGLLTVDSGPMHIAAAQGVPVVSIWGPQRPEFYAPRVPGVRTVYANYPCSPCIHMFTSFEGMWCHHEAWCMDAIGPQAVLEAVNAMLEERKASGSRLQASGAAGVAVLDA
jgi:ADP-heptose:LPS heptosyltransferase